MQGRQGRVVAAALANSERHQTRLQLEREKLRKAGQLGRGRSFRPVGLSNVGNSWRALSRE